MGEKFTMRKSDGVRVDHKKQRWVGVDHEKKSDGVRCLREKER